MDELEGSLNQQVKKVTGGWFRMVYSDELLAVVQFGLLAIHSVMRGSLIAMSICFKGLRSD